ncbi:uncharacterized protein LOC127788175 [Diospyros lotus]|uniref:uncharacterized protein LOC127788175 n=1 Tax=Diospyros lotus TaxID=55363 RepID=UPI002253877E|nr:uncharacterized protein LOC127788175 [Diospyros lotus]
MALVNLKQNQGESLKDFVARFNMEALSIKNFDHSVAMVAFQNALRPNPFAQSLAKTPSLSFMDILGWATKYINAEEVMQAKRAEYTEKKEQKKHSEENKGEDRKEDREKKHHPRWESSSFTPLNAPRAEILATIEGKDCLKKPLPMRAPCNKRNRNKYCRFHRDHGHDTKECHQLKEEIQQLINRGFLRGFVSRVMDSWKRRERRSQSPPPMRDRAEERDFCSEFAPDGEATASRGGSSTSPSVPYPCREGNPRSEGREGLRSGSNLRAELRKWELWWILVDPGSSSKILYRQAFLAFVGSGKGFPNLSGHAGYFGGRRGQSGLNALWVILSTYHMMMKFSTINGVGEVRGDLRSAWECYRASISVTRGAETPQGKRKKNSPKGETSGYKKDLEGKRDERPPPAISFLLEGSGI